MGQAVYRVDAIVGARVCVRVAQAVKVQPVELEPDVEIVGAVDNDVYSDVAFVLRPS